MPERTTETYIRPNTEDYIAGWSGNGKRTKISGDTVSLFLNGMTNDEVKDVLGKLDKELDVDKYDHLNVGQVRMNLGARVRGFFNKARKEYLAEHEGDEAGADAHGQSVLEKAAGKNLLKTVEKRIEGFEKSASERAEKRAAAKAEKEAA